MTVRRFQAADYSRFQAQEILRMPVAYPVLLAQMGHAVTWWEQDEPIACAGLVPIFPHTAEAWTVISRQVMQHPLIFSRSVSRMLRLGWDVMRLHRVQTYVACASPRFVRWAELQGFRREGRLVAWGPSREDYWIMAKVSA